MSENEAKIGTKLDFVLQLVNENDVRDTAGEAVASVLLNPTVAWAKFVLTDDSPNGNGQRIPQEEFDNMIKSGLHMPVKMAEGRVEEGHEDSKPIGTIAYLKKEGNKLIALAALWAGERPADVNLLRDIMDGGGDVNVSWELSYGDSQFSEGGVQDLKDVILRAATVVARPAYMGRTRFLAIAAKARNWSKAYVESLPDSSFLVIEPGGEKDSEGRTFPRTLRHFPVKDEQGLYDRTRLEKSLEEMGEANLSQNSLKNARKTVKTLLEKLDSGASLEEVSFGQRAQKENLKTEEVTLNELEQLKERLADVETRLQEALSQLQAKDGELANASQNLTALAEEKSALEAELTSLREYKQAIDAKEAEAQRLGTIKTKFQEAGVEKEDTYFEENKESLLKLDDAALDFMVQELVSFKEKESQASLTKTEIPNIPGEKPKSVSIEDIAGALRAARKAK